MKLVKTGSAALFAAALMALAPATSAQAAVCKGGTVSALGDWSNTFVGARLQARLAWKAKAQDIHGSAFDTWWMSENKSYGCWSAGGRERCRAVATPCRFGS